MDENKMEKRILLDTSVYGKLAEDSFLYPLLLEKKKQVDFVFYGAPLIRNELRATPKYRKIENKSIRAYVLFLYDNLITKENHILKMNFFIEKLSELYITEYKRRGGSFSSAELKNDFIIVAYATMYGLDILVSNDKRTMFSNTALLSYGAVNKTQGFKNPTYLHYNKFREQLLKRSGIL